MSTDIFSVPRRTGSVWLLASELERAIVEYIKAFALTFAPT